MLFHALFFSVLPILAVTMLAGGVWFTVRLGQVRVAESHAVNRLEKHADRYIKKRLQACRDTTDPSTCLRSAVKGF